MTVHGRDPRVYARGLPWRKPSRDRDARLLLSVAEAHKSRGSAAFNAWLAESPRTRLDALRGAMGSPDPRAALRATRLLLWWHQEGAIDNLHALSADDLEALESFQREYASRDHGGRRALRWREGLTRRQEREGRGHKGRS